MKLWGELQSVTGRDSVATQIQYSQYKENWNSWLREKAKGPAGLKPAPGKRGRRGGCYEEYVQRDRPALCHWGPVWSLCLQTSKQDFSKSEGDRGQETSFPTPQCGPWEGPRSGFFSQLRLDYGQFMFRRTVLMVKNPAQSTTITG